MGFTSFGTGLVWRVGLLIVTVAGATLAALRESLPASLAVGGGLVLWQGVALYRYVTGTNRKLTRFLESVRYSDFAITFRAGDGLGTSFRDLNQQFNEVLEAFRQARAEKEANLHYLNAIVQHVSVGLLSLDAAGNVELVNQAALRLLGLYRLRTRAELETAHPALAALLLTATVTTPLVYSAGEEQELSVRCTTLRLRGRMVTLVSLQNIRSELQQKEVEAWQNLTKVLRHEIMNSLTPVVSLAATMHQIVETELSDGTAPADSIADLREALGTIEQRGKGLMRFVDAYRHFTTLPQPRLSEISVEMVLKNVIQLIQPDLQTHHITLQSVLPSPTLRIQADASQLEMVLINLLKNAAESVETIPQPLISLTTELVGDRWVRLAVTDNGPGIEPEALEKVFIPFFTTKKTGSGIGLSLSRQIIQLHNGQIRVHSADGQGCTVELLLPIGGRENQ